MVGEGRTASVTIMSDEPAVAVAVAQGSLPAGVVEATAVGVPRLARDHSNSARAVEPSDAAPSAVAVAEAYVYSPFMAKVFAGFDADASGYIECDELQ